MFNIEQFLDLNNKEILDMNKGKRFGICLMNPPYDKNIHLKFLEKVIEISDKVISIQPIHWLEDPIAKEKKTSNYNKYEESISKHIKSLDIINSKKATELFGGEGQTQIAVNLGIYVCDENGGYNYLLNEGFPYNLYKKQEYPFKTGLYKDNKDKNFVCLISFAGCLKRGNPVVGCTNKYGVFINGKDKNGQTFEEAKKSNKAFTNGNIDNQLIAIFDTKIEANNFYEMCISDFWRFICYMSTKSNSLSLKYLPWPKNYKEKWTEEKFYKYFKLSEKDIKLFKSTIKTLKDTNKI